LTWLLLFWPECYAEQDFRHRFLVAPKLGKKNAKNDQKTLKTVCFSQFFDFNNRIIGILASGVSKSAHSHIPDKMSTIRLKSA
jgi:hypothetical protein